MEQDAINIHVCVGSCAETNDANSTVMAHLYASTPILNLCAPASLDPSAFINSAINTYLSSWPVLFADLQAASSVIYASAGFTVVVAFLVLIVIRHCAGVIFWGVVVGLVVGAVSAGVELLQQAANGHYSSDLTQWIRAAGIVMLVLTGIFVLALFFMRNAIRVALEVVKEASHALSDLKSLLLFPLLPATLCVLYLVVAALVAMEIFSINTYSSMPSPIDVLFRGSVPLANSNVTIISAFDRSYSSSLVFCAFHVLFTTQFFFYFGFSVTAGAVAEWYFSRYEGGSKVRGNEEGQLSHYAVSQSFFRTLVFNMGTVALCALIIAIIQSFRAVVLYLEKRTGTDPRNALQRALFCLINCCLKCLECCCDKLNKNALIWTAVTGDSFFAACCKSFKLIWQNMARTAALHISGVVLSVSSVATAVMTTGIAALVMAHTTALQVQLSTLLLPLIAVFTLSYTLSRVIFGVLDTCVDTVFLCFLMDKEAVFASPSLQKLVNKYADESARVANERKATRSQRPGGTEAIAIV